MTIVAFMAAFISSVWQAGAVCGTGHGLMTDSTAVDSTAAPDSLSLQDSAAVADSLFRPDSTVKGGMLEQPAFSTAVDSIIEDFSSGRKMIYYYGDASVTYGDMKLTAEYMEYDMDRQVVYAAGVADTAGVVNGKPEMTQGGKTYSMDNVFYNFKTGKARIKNMVTA